MIVRYPNKTAWLSDAISKHKVKVLCYHLFFFVMLFVVRVLYVVSNDPSVNNNLPPCNADTVVSSYLKDLVFLKTRARKYQQAVSIAQVSAL